MAVTKTPKLLDEHKVSFRCDKTTWDALQALEEKEGPNVRGRTSALLRKLILAASKLTK